MTTKIRHSAAAAAVGLASFFIGWAAAIAFDVTATGGKFPDTRGHIAAAAAAALHIMTALPCRMYLGKRAENRAVFPAGAFMTLFPYAYLAFVSADIFFR